MRLALCLPVVLLCSWSTPPTWVVQSRALNGERFAIAEAAGPSVLADTVQVPPPTGSMERDRANLVAAFDRAEPGDTIQFAAGLYRTGPVIRVATRGLTLLGHPNGTVLRGCDPEEYEANERRLIAAEGRPSREVVARCGIFELSGGHVSVRRLAFENARLGLLLGCCHLEPRFEKTPGGYVIEGNTFRNSLNGIRPWTTEPSVIRGNTFVNTFHAISGVGSHLHVLDNTISVPDPSLVAGVGHPSFAISLGPLPGPAADALGLEENGEGVVIAGNRIAGHPDGIFISVYPGSSFKGNVIQNNSIVVTRVPIPAGGARSYIVDVTEDTDRTVVGVPIGLYVRSFSGAAAPDLPDGSFDDNLIAENRIVGAEGVGLVLQRGRGNRIVGNVLRDVSRREPFPGNTVASGSELWGEDNGSGIWVSPGSDHNQILGNVFERVAGPAVVVRGDRNLVLLSPVDSVLDMGEGNRVAKRSGAGEPAAPAALRDSVLALTRGLAEAWIRLDADAYLGQFSEDLVFYFEGRAVTRTQFEDAVRRSLAALRESTFDIMDPEVEPLGDDAAVVSFALRERMVSRQDAVTDLRAVLTLVWERRDGRWLVVRAHESLTRQD